MKKVIITIACLAIIIIAGLFYLYFGGEKDYVNNNIPSNYKFTQENQIIPDEFAIPAIKKQLGDSMEYLAGELYDNQYFYQKKGEIYCKNNNMQPEKIIYYLYIPSGKGGARSRSAFTCSDKYFIKNFDNVSGPRIYGPFD